jgi:hypothetical protein
VELSVRNLDNTQKINLFKALIFCISAFCFTSAQSQVWELGGGIGTCTYRGEIVKYFQPLEVRPSTTLIVKHNFNPSFLLKFTVNYGFISGNDRYQKGDYYQQRSYNLSASIWEVAFTPEYNFLDFRKKSYRQTQKWSPYFYGGLAVWGYNSKLTVNNVSVNPENLPTNKIDLCIPMGIGAKYSINHFWNVGFEVGARKTFTDALDLTSNINENRFQTGDNTKNDWYFISTFFVTYTFWGVRCPESLKDLQ